MAERETFIVPSSDGHSRLYGRIWKPKGQPIMVLQIAHGMLEHMGCYDDFAAWLADQGVLVAGHDHLGHGRTAADREQLGFFAEKDGYTFLVRDLHRVRTVLSRRYPGVPYLVLWGFSRFAQAFPCPVCSLPTGVFGEVSCSSSVPRRSDAVRSAGSGRSVRYSQTRFH